MADDEWRHRIEQCMARAQKEPHYSYNVDDEGRDAKGPG